MVVRTEDLLKVLTIKKSQAKQIVLPTYDITPGSLWSRVRQAARTNTIGWAWKDVIAGDTGFLNQHGNYDCPPASRKVLLVKLVDSLYWFGADDSGETFGKPQIFV